MCCFLQLNDCNTSPRGSIEQLEYAENYLIRNKKNNPRTFIGIYILEEVYRRN